MNNNLVEVWREEFESIFNEKYNQVHCGHTLKQWTAQNLMNQEFKFGLNYYIKARKKAQEDIEFWKNEYVSHSETMCKCQEKLQKTREQLEIAEKVISADIGYNVFEFHRLREEYFKNKQSEG